MFISFGKRFANKSDVNSKQEVEVTEKHRITVAGMVLKVDSHEQCISLCCDEAPQVIPFSDIYRITIIQPGSRSEKQG